VVGKAAQNVRVYTVYDSEVGEGGQVGKLMYSCCSGVHKGDGQVSKHAHMHVLTYALVWQ